MSCIRKANNKIPSMKVSKRFPKNTTTFSWYAAMAVVIKNVLIVGCWMLDVGTHLATMMKKIRTIRFMAMKFQEVSKCPIYDACNADHRHCILAIACCKWFTT
jgi:hypothetical protein